MIAREFGFYYDDEDAKQYLKWNFEKKLQFLKKQGVLYSDEFEIIKKFQECRNKLFHGKDQPPFVILSDVEKDEFMDNAVEAAQLALDIGFGLHGKRPKE